MSERLNIYDINNPYYLYEDIEVVLNEIEELYTVQFNSGSKRRYYSKTIVSKEYSWAGEECKNTFNKLIPKIKSITKDMYSIIEGIMKSRNGEFKKLDLEKEHKNLRHLRVFNNKLKHHNNREAIFNLTELLHLNKDGHVIDVMIQYKYDDEDKKGTILFTDLIEVFLEILEKEKIILINH